MSLYARAVLALLLVAAAAACWWRLEVALRRADAAGYARAQAEANAAAEVQREANRLRARAAETTYTAAAQERERVVIETIREVRHVAAPLADCRLPESLRGLLNDAVARAGQDRPAAGGAGLGLRAAGPAAARGDGAVAGGMDGGLGRGLGLRAGQAPRPD